MFKPVKRDTRCAYYVSSGFRYKFFCFSQNSIMDIRRFFNDGEKGKDDSSEKKRPAEEGASARPPPP